MNNNLYIRCHSYSSKCGKDISETNGLYSRCIYCGETIGQGWYGTSDDCCKERLNVDLVKSYIEFHNMCVVNWDAVDNELFAVKRYSNEEFSFNDIVSKITSKN